MAKNEKKTITVNDVEHNVAYLTDLDKKLGNLRFNMDQLNVGREAFVNMLAASLAEAESAEEAEVVNG